jgi:hypothetical protein
MEKLEKWGIIRKTKNVSGVIFFVVKSSSKWFNEINEYFSKKYSIDAVLYHYQYNSKKSQNGYKENPDKTRIKENNGFYYIQSEKFQKEL